MTSMSSTIRWIALQPLVNRMQVIGDRRSRFFSAERLPLILLRGLLSVPFSLLKVTETWFLSLFCPADLLEYLPVSAL